MTNHPFGELLAEAAGRDGARVRIFAGGFEGTSRFGEISARWEDVAYVNRAHQRVDAVVFQKQYSHVELGTASGARFVLDGDDGNAALGARLLAERALPHVEQRLFHQIQQGPGAAFGPDARLTANGVEVQKGGRFIALPYPRLAGWKVTQGFCLIDEDPARPTLVAQLSLARMTNPDTFLALLDRFAPGKDLDNHPYRVPGSAWRTSAATHDPRYVSTRTRLMAFVGVPGAILGLFMFFVVTTRVVSCIGGMAGSRWSAEEKSAFEAVVKAQIAAVEAAPPPAKPLSEACETWNPTSALMAFTAPAAGVTGLPPGVVPAYVLPRFAGWDWAGKELPIPDTKEPKLIVVRLLSGTRVEASGAADVRQHVRVVNGKSGVVVCEGVVEGRWEAAAGKTAEESTRYGLVKLALLKMCKDGYYGVCDKVLDYKDGMPITVATASPSAAVTAAATATATASAKTPPAKGKSLRR